MNWKDEINADLIKGFSKSDLELLIGLPKNTLASLLLDKKKISKKSLLKIDKWNSSEKCSPLDVENIKAEMELVKMKLEGKGKASGESIDITKTGIKFGDTIISGLAAFNENGEKSFIPIEPPITLIKAPKTLDELKAMCPKELTGFDKSQWIAQNRVKYGI